MEINKFLELVDEFGLVIVPFETAPKELKALTDGLGHEDTMTPDEGEVVVYHKSALFSGKFDDLCYSSRISQLADYLSVGDHQEHKYGDYIVNISTK